MTSIDVVPGFKPLVHDYGEHDLQVLTVWKNTSLTSIESRFWIIYIHGGAWRDPRIANATFLPSIRHFLERSPELAKTRVAAFASIDYRLSAHPSFPQDPKTTPQTELRAARHPDHISDVTAALMYLQNEYGMGDKYVLVGHSCGATLAFQAVMTPQSVGQDRGLISAPQAILGVSGIYDLRLMRDNHKDIGVYDQFVRDAFGDNEVLWDQVSPAKCKNFGESWKSDRRVVVLASSSGDELIEDEQLVVMLEQLKRVQGIKTISQRNKLLGGHDEIWEKGTELGVLLELVLNQVSK